jgi:hypothetical protein
VTLLAAAPVLAQGGGQGGGQGCWVQDKQGHQIACFCDKRLNATDIMAPVAIYYRLEDRQLRDKNNKAYNAKVPVGIELWSINSQGVGQKTAYIPYADFQAALSAAADSTFYSSGGLTLGYSVGAKSFWFSAPGYSFVWKAPANFYT